MESPRKTQVSPSFSSTRSSSGFSSGAVVAGAAGCCDIAVATEPVRMRRVRRREEIMGRVKSKGREEGCGASPEQPVRRENCEQVFPRRSEKLQWHEGKRHWCFHGEV